MTIPNNQREALMLGAPKYKTGKPCKRGHVAERYTLTANCCECVKEAVERRRDLFRAIQAKSEA